MPSSYTGPDPIVNTATVSSTATDPDLTNNSATATTAVGPLFTINVEITKAGPASVTPGTNLVLCDHRHATTGRSMRPT